jgi:hypothetical protein
MEEKYSVGMFGYFEFTIRYKNKYGEQVRGFNGHFEIVEMDSRNLLLADPDMQVLVTKRRVKKFEQMPKPDICHA